MKKNKTLLVLSLVGIMAFTGISYSSIVPTFVKSKINQVTRKRGRLNPLKKQESLNAVGEIALETLDKYVDSNKYSISRILEIKDFGENQYVLVEFDPIGYLIYNVSNGDIVECAPTSYSPYLKTKSTNLYYLPMVGYFSNISGKYTSLMDDKELNALQYDAYKKEANRYHDKAIKVIDEKNLNRAYEGSKTDFSKKRKSTTVTNHHFFTMIYADDEARYSWYFKQNSADFAAVSTEDGCCGYIATGIILAYYEIYYSTGYFSTSQASNYISPCYSTTYGDGVPNIANNFLYELDPNPGSITQAQIINKLNTFLSGKDLNYTIQNTVSIFTDIETPIENGYPAIYCGTMPNFNGGNISHGVVVYGIYDNGDVLCHYGWSGYSQVVMSSLGLFQESGAISINDHTSHRHNKYFIINGNTHCGCGDMILC
ncbi:MAG: hypothetical protein E7177_05825 [Erysipelotrichaceae bacterium]|nr:hypothetical protein [Erysipelotrichaceae bacterium]